MKRLIPILVLFILVFAAPAIMAPVAGTYYIDFTSGSDEANGTAKETPWKLCPGMYGFAGEYTHVAGDTFIFKGNETWTGRGLDDNGNGVAVLEIGYSGTAGNIDTYTVDDTWYTGASYGYPIFDGNDGYVLEAYYRGYFTINGIKLINSSPSYFGSAMNNIRNEITISNCWIETTGSNGLSFSFNAITVTVAGLHIFGNYFKDHQNHIFFNAYRNTSGVGVTFSDLDIHDNQFASMNQIGGATLHPDDVQIIGYTSSMGAAYTEDSLTDVKIYNNKFFGTWWRNGTSLLYVTGATGMKVYDNVFTFENTNYYQEDLYYLFSPSMVYFKHSDTVKVYNNTFDSSSISTIYKGAKALLQMDYGCDNVDIQNNIFCNGYLGVVWTGCTECTNMTLDYNLYKIRASGGYAIWGMAPLTRYNTLAKCQAVGFETNSPAFGDPSFLSPTDGTEGSSNLGLTAGSSLALNTGADLGETYATDILGQARPVGVGWDIGAYEYVTAGADTTNPAITITSPTADSTYPTGSATINISGTASDNVALLDVSWADGIGGGGLTTGTTTWSVTGISLHLGLNVITVTARDTSGNTSSDVITVVYTLAGYPAVRSGLRLRVKK